MDWLGRISCLVVCHGSTFEAIWTSCQKIGSGDIDCDWGLSHARTVAMEVGFRHWYNNGLVEDGKRIPSCGSKYCCRVVIIDRYNDMVLCVIVAIM